VQYGRYKAEREITMPAVSAGKSSGSAPDQVRFSRPSGSGWSQLGNVSKNSSKRLPDSFAGAEFHMYSCATVITIHTDDTFGPFVMRFLPYSNLSTADVDLF
jgi:hypothetical protein